MDASEPRTWQFRSGIPWWFWMCVAIPAMVLVAMSLAPLPSAPWVGPKPEVPEIWLCEPESVWTAECTDQMPALFRTMPDALSIQLWNSLILPRMDPVELEALANGEPFREGAEAAWEAALRADPPPTISAEEYQWAWSFFRVFHEEVGEPFDYRDTTAAVERIPELMAGVTPERRARAQAVSKRVEQRWQQVGGREVSAALERLREPYFAAIVRWEGRRDAAEAFEHHREARRAERNVVRFAAAVWLVFALSLGAWLRRPTEVRITGQHLRIGRHTFEWMDVVKVRSEFGQLIVYLRDGREVETARLEDADEVLRDLRAQIHRQLRSDEAAREEQADRVRVKEALAAVREGDGRQP